jgi:hypothetical protein
MFSDRCLVVRVQCSVFLSQTGGMDALKNGGAVPLLVQAVRNDDLGIAVWRVTCDVWPEYYEIGDIMKARDPCFQPRI